MPPHCPPHTVGTEPCPVQETCTGTPPAPRLTIQREVEARGLHNRARLGLADSGAARAPTCFAGHSRETPQAAAARLDCPPTRSLAEGGWGVVDIVIISRGPLPSE